MDEPACQTADAIREDRTHVDGDDWPVECSGAECSAEGGSDHDPAQRFDVLVVDAFSGDSVPIHLLTLEAFAQYFRHLKPGGVLAVHITNRFLDLRPVVKTAADHFAKDARIVDSQSIPEKLVLRSRWVLISSDPAFFKDPRLSSATTFTDPTGFQPWKDDYSSIFSILK